MKNCVGAGVFIWKDQIKNKGQTKSQTQRDPKTNRTKDLFGKKTKNKKKLLKFIEGKC